MSCITARERVPLGGKKCSDMFSRMIVRIARRPPTDGCACYSGAVERRKRIAETFLHSDFAHTAVQWRTRVKPLQLNNCVVTSGSREFFCLRVILPNTRIFIIPRGSARRGVPAVPANRLAGRRVAEHPLLKRDLGRCQLDIYVQLDKTIDNNARRAAPRRWNLRWQPRQPAGQ